MNSTVGLVEGGVFVIAGRYTALTTDEDTSHYETHRTSPVLNKRRVHLNLVETVHVLIPRVAYLQSTVKSKFQRETIDGFRSLRPEFLLDRIGTRPWAGVGIQLVPY